LKSTSQLKY